mmetsp:Transcript_49547/g.89090  ORF Transcript_49547/g.89090 Transcript_49547/m.89090 type:complete len:152 (+) Transcript_49547:3-458(+)
MLQSEVSIAYRMPAAMVAIQTAFLRDSRRRRWLAAVAVATTLLLVDGFVTPSRSFQSFLLPSPLRTERESDMSGDSDSHGAAFLSAMAAICGSVLPLVVNIAPAAAVREVEGPPGGFFILLLLAVIGAVSFLSNAAAWGPEKILGGKKDKP